MADAGRAQRVDTRFNQLGIRLGVGNQTLLTICEAHDLNPEFILTVLNVYLDDTYTPDSALQMFDTGLIADYPLHG